MRLLEFVFYVLIYWTYLQMEDKWTSLNPHRRERKARRERNDLLCVIYKLCPK